MRKILGSMTAIAIANLTANAALAQDIQSQEGAIQGNVANAGDNSGRGIGDIVVTARRRAENVQKSSLSISVLNGADLVRRGVAQASDLTRTTPTITISQSGAFTQTNIRGAGDFSGNGLAQTAVAYSVDGVVIGQAPGVSQNFYDLARVEVLKGPQGTLYGRNATAGAVNIITARPTQKFEGYVTAEYGHYDSKRLTGAINVPLNSTLAVRGAFNIVDRDGYLSDGTDDDVRQSGRLQAYWKPTDRFNLRLYGDYSHTGGKGGGVVLFPRQPGTGKWTAASDPINNAAIAANGSAPFLPDSFIDMKQWNFSGEMNVELEDFATLTVIPAYRYLELNQRSYTIGFLGNFNPQTTKQTSVEARLGHQSDKLKWTLGAFYYNDDTYFHIDAIALAEPTPVQRFNVTSDINSQNRSYAAFGEATLILTDKLRVIGGLRYTHDRVSYSGTLTDRGTPPDPLSPFAQLGRRAFNDVSWRGGVEYDVASQSMAYFTASKGYKAGGFFYVSGGTDNTFDPERLTSFEVGLRNRFFDNALQVNLEGFYWKYRNQQLTSVGYTASGVIAYLTRNAGSSDPRGASIDVVWKPAQNDTLGFNVAYVDAKYDQFNVDFPAALAFTLPAGTACAVPTTPTMTPGGQSVLRVNCSGLPLPRTPQWAGTASYQHVFPLADGGKLTFNANATLATSRYLSIDFFSPETKADGYALVDADLTYATRDDKYSITAFVKNIGNEAVYNGGVASAVNGFGGPSVPTFVVRTIGAPRTYGVRATARF